MRPFAKAWANTDGGTINEAPLTGGTATTLVTGQDQPNGVAIDSSHIYWSNQEPGTINEAPLTGGNATTLVSRRNWPQALAVGP